MKLKWNIPISNRTALFAGAWSGITSSVAFNSEYVGRYLDVSDLGTSILLSAITWALPLLLFVWEASPNPFMSRFSENLGPNARRTGIFILGLIIPAMFGLYLSHPDDVQLPEPKHRASDGKPDSAAWITWSFEMQAAVRREFNNGHFKPSGCQDGAKGALQTNIDEDGALALWTLKIPSGCAPVDEQMLQSANAARAKISPSPRRNTLLNYPFGVGKPSVDR